jgi:hypothetical protein
LLEGALLTVKSLKLVIQVKAIHVLAAEEEVDAAAQFPKRNSALDLVDGVLGAQAEVLCRAGDLITEERRYSTATQDSSKT